MGKTTVFVGSFAWRGGKGIYTFEADTDTGAFRPIGVTEADNPSYIAVDSAQRTLYCVLEVGKRGDVPGGAVAAYRIQPDQSLTFLGERSSVGGGPTHLSLSKDGKYLFAANYGEGTAISYPILADGTIGEHSAYFVHEGSGPDAQRQQKPHAHFALQAPDERWLCVVDLGIDGIMMYPYDKAKGPRVEGAVKVSSPTPGAGPRHMVFSKDGKRAYVVCELISQIEVFDYLGEGGLKPKQTISTLPEGYDGTSYCAAIRVSDCGRYVYASNRGHDSVAAFEAQPDGTLRLIGIEPTGGKNPRDIHILPGGKFLLCGNQDEGGITLLKIAENGSLSPAGIAVDTPAPVNFAFAD